MLFHLTPFILLHRFINNTNWRTSFIWC